MQESELIIIGGGPAGITAGIYASRKRLKTILITRDFIGQAGKTSKIDNYPGLYGISGPKFMERLKEHIKKFEIEIVEGEEVIKVSKKGNKFLVKTDKEKQYLSKALIVATGRDPRPLEIPGEKELLGKGVSYCSICDAPFFKDKQVIVVGGGNSGFEAALDLAEYAKKIYIFERGKKPIADEILQEEIERNSKIKVFCQIELKEIIGKDKVEAVRYFNLKTKKEYQMPAGGVFVQIGQIPATGFLKGLVKFNQKDEIEVDLATCKTSCPGIFAAGDVNSGPYKQIVIAVGEGARSALSAQKYLRKS